MTLRPFDNDGNLDKVLLLALTGRAVRNCAWCGRLLGDNPAPCWHEDPRLLRKFAEIADLTDHEIEWGGKLSELDFVVMVACTWSRLDRFEDRCCDSLSYGPVALHVNIVRGFSERFGMSADARLLEERPDMTWDLIAGQMLLDVRRVAIERGVIPDPRVEHEQRLEEMARRN